MSKPVSYVITELVVIGISFLKFTGAEVDVDVGGSNLGQVSDMIWRIAYKKPTGGAQTQ